jgi:hypothetical protein
LTVTPASHNLTGDHRNIRADMRQALKLHPDSRCDALTGIEVDVARAPSGHLALRYSVTGKIGEVRLPPITVPMRADELWRHSCFEAFVRTSPGAAYYEFNFAPSTQWAAYRFNDYRSGMDVANEPAAPRLETRSNGGGYELQVSLELDRLPDLPSDAPWRLGLSAVIEETNGRISYWALAHPPGKADFHRPDCFALELPAA